MSDPSSNWNYFAQGSLKRSGVRKSRSETVSVDGVGENGCAEVEASNIEDGELESLIVFHNVSVVYINSLDMKHDSLIAFAVVIIAQIGHT